MFEARSKKDKRWLKKIQGRERARTAAREEEYPGWK